MLVPENVKGNVVDGIGSHSMFGLTTERPKPQLQLRLCINLHSMMLFVFTIFIFIHHIQAYPILTLDLDRSPPSTCADTRSIWTIIWSSLVTLFACIWIAVHPNVSGPAHGILEKLISKQRMKLLLTAIIAPEFIVLFAMRQWVCARNAMKSKFGKGEGFILLS